VVAGEIAGLHARVNGERPATWEKEAGSRHEHCREPAFTDGLVCH
jgi:hypothetical protein